jgi:hypothetical protein
VLSGTLGSSHRSRPIPGYPPVDTSQHPVPPPPVRDPDVIFELFGDVQLTPLTTAIQPELNNILWKIKGPLGNIVYSAIRGKPNPAEALVQVLYERRLDKSLGDAFREYVLDSDGLRYMLTPQARRTAEQRKAQASPPPVEPSPCIPLHPLRVPDIPSDPDTSSGPGAPSGPDISGPDAPKNTEDRIAEDISKVAQLASDKGESAIANDLHP